MLANDVVEPVACELTIGPDVLGVAPAAPAMLA